MREGVKRPAAVLGKSWSLAYAGSMTHGAALMRLPLCLIVSLLALLVAATAQAAGRTATPLREYFQESWTTADGLPHNLVSDIVQTQEGYLWFATWEGAVRYNGQRFDVFDETVIPGLPDRGVTELDVDSRQRLLIGTARGGLARREHNGWQIVSTNRGNGAPSIYSFLDTGNERLIGTAGDGLLVLGDDNQVTRRVGAEALDDAIIYTLHAGSDGATWIGSSRGLYRLRAGNLVQVGVGQGLPPGAILSMIELPSGDLVLGTERGAFVWSGDAIRPLADALPEGSIESMMLDRHGDLWIGTAAHGLFRLNEGRVEHLDNRAGLPNSRVAALLEDREGSIWVGTNGGLLRLREAPFQSVTASDGLPDDYVRALTQDRQGRVWVGTSSGLGWVGEKLDAVHTVAGELAGESILSLDSHGQDGVWVGTYFAGLLHWQDNQVVRRVDRRHGLPSNQVRAVIQADNGVVWAGTTGGLARIEGDQLSVFGVAEGLPNASVLSLFIDSRQRLWVGTTLGMAVMEGDRLQPVHDPAIAAAQRIYGFSEDSDGAIWVGSDRGVLRLKNGRWVSVGPSQGLPVASLFGVNIDRSGTYWLSSNRGVVRVDGRQMNAVMDGQRSHVLSELFTEADGMASAQCNGASGPTSLVASDGAIWFGTARGISRIDPPRLEEFPRLLPAVVMEQVLVDGESRPVDEALNLQAGARRIEFRFVGLSFQAPGKLRYRYRLEGFDKDWVESGRDRVAQFTHLPPGSYRFHGSAANANGEWSPNEALLVITVSPLWWQRKDVQLLALFLVVGAAFWLPRARLKQLAARERKLHEQVSRATRDLQQQAEFLREQNLELDAYAHTVAHDLKTPLTTVLGLARVLDQARDQLAPELQRSSLQRIHALSQKMAAIIDALLLLSRARSDQALSLSPVDNTALIDDALQRLDELRERSAAQIIRPASLPAVQGYAPWVEEVWVNFLSNAIKYGGTPARIEVGADPEQAGQIRLWVKDNGPGLSVEAQSSLFQPFSRVAEIGGEGHGLGLSIVRRIVERMGGRVGCDSSPGKGSRFWFTLPAAGTVTPP